MWVFFFFLIPFSFAVNVWTDELRPTFQSAGESDNLLILAGGTVATFSAEHFDGKVRGYRNQDGNLLIGRNESHTVDMWTYGPIQVVTALPLLLIDTKEGVRLSKALILTSLSHLTLSRIIRRDRPGNSDSYSMPSGHTSSMFAYAGVLAGSYGWKAGVPAYLAATLTGISRIKEDDHWFSDVVAGMFLGTYWARVVSEEKSKNYALVPAPVDDGAMVTFIYLW